jgi:hypothetical protein
LRSCVKEVPLRIHGQAVGPANTLVTRRAAHPRALARPIWGSDLVSAREGDAGVPNAILYTSVQCLGYGLGDQGIGIVPRVIQADSGADLIHRVLDAVSPVVKRPGHRTNHSLPSSDEVKNV